MSDVSKDKYFNKPVRGILIRDDWYEIVETDDPQKLLEADEIEIVALKLGGEYYGCICDANARTSGRYNRPDTVVLRKKHLLKKDQFFGYVHGPVFIYLNRGLDDIDIEFIKRRIILHKDDAKSPCLIVEEFQNMEYEKTDP